MMYTLKQGNKTLGFPHKGRSYVIGFSDTTTARKVHYNINPKPNFTVVRQNEVAHDIGLTWDKDAALFIPKCVGGPHHPLNDAFLHLQAIPVDEFFMLPAKGVGIIIPYELKDEDDEEFFFKSHLVEPIE